jgi:chondroitin AC lyase
MGTTTPERLITVSDYRKDELAQIVKIRKGELTQYPSFDKFFWQTEHYVHQRPGYFASVRMHSVRNDNMEVPYNSEGLKNHHRGDGTNHISVTGLEYQNIAPVFDWQKIPGATILQKPSLPSENEIQKKGLTEFVGAVTDGKYGAVAYDFKSPHDPVSAKKAWFFFDKEYVCLGTAISAGSKLPLATTLNQCLLKGDVVVKTANGQTTVAKGERQLEQVRWILHDGIGYVFPEAQKVSLSNQAKSGSWYSINRQIDSPKEEISLDVFKLWIDHGSSATNASYQYIVVPGITLPEMENNDSRNIRILANTPQMQAVMHSGLNVCQMIFHSSGEMELGANLKIGSDTPGIVMVKMEGSAVKQISVADPSRKLRRMHLTMTGKVEKAGDHFQAKWNEKKGTTDFAIDLPQTVYAGKSVTIEL